MNAIEIKQPAQPWYREPWPWLLMSGPATVIVAGVITTTMAFRSSDGLVADDYYKQGLMINKALARDQHASSRGLAATGWYVPGDGTASGGRIRIALKGDSAVPASVSLRLVHPTRSGQDRTVVLSRSQAGFYEGRLDVPVGNNSAGGRWLVTLEQGDWRLTGEWLPGTAMQLSSGQS
jgi:hypothetical protein